LRGSRNAADDLTPVDVGTTVTKVDDDDDDNDVDDDDKDVDINEHGAEISDFNLSTLAANVFNSYNIAIIIIIKPAVSCWNK